MSTRTAVQGKAAHPLPLLTRWKTAWDGCNVPQIELADGFTRWLVISRACVFTMTIISGMLGLLIAAEQATRGAGSVNWFFGFLAIIGIMLAHASNNLLNDYMDVRQGVDTEDYPRAQYSTHPILGGLTTPNGLLKAAGLLTFIDFLIMLYLYTQVGAMVLVFAVLGFVLSFFYTNVLKRAGLGELTAFVVWGPLMTGGTAYVALNGMPLTTEIWALTLPYGLVVASVLVGKHIDKIEPDTKVGVRSVPVILGEERSKLLNKAIFILFYVIIVALVVLNYTGPGVLLTFLALPYLRRSWQKYSEPKPKKAPEGWTVWPLWFVGWAMHFNRKAGGYFTLGLLVNIGWHYISSLL
ncbi:MAG: prenyltransferase [Anaerolineales bacterium]|nr:prenyltransferase [Anaerolineales bacterium]